MFSIAGAPPPVGGGSKPASVEDDEDVALAYRLPLLHLDLADDATILGLDRHLHLHRLEDHDRVALVDRVARCDLDLPHGAGYVRLDVWQRCPSVVAGSRQDNLTSAALGPRRLRGLGEYLG